MPKGTVAEESEYRYEEGWAKLRLESVIEREIEFRYRPDSPVVKRGDAVAGQKGSFVQWRWTMKFQGGDYNGDTISVDTEPRVSTRADSKARLLYEALLGREVEVGEDIDTDKVEGLTCWGFVQHDEPRKKKDGTDGYYCSIGDVKPSNADDKGSQDPFDEPPF